MSANKNDFLRRNPARTDLQFFSAVTASVTHELNNVLSIINQTGGLLEDLLMGIDQGEAIQPEQLERIAGKISLQTERGIEIIKRLNNFSHTCDKTDAFDILELTGGIIELSQRFAAMARVNMTLDKTDSVPAIISNDPLKIQKIVFLILHEVFKSAEKDDTISVSTGKKDDTAIIAIQHRISAEPYIPDLTSIAAIAEEIGGRVEVLSTENMLTYNISIADRAKISQGSENDG